jgi:hypothetical protein
MKHMANRLADGLAGSGIQAGMAVITPFATVEEALEEMALSSMEPPRSRAGLLVDAARAAISAGKLPMALGQVQRALHQANVGSCKIAVARNIASDKFIQQVAHLHDRRHRQSGGHNHQHDQYNRNPHDLAPDGQADHGLTSSRYNPQFDWFTFTRRCPAGSHIFHRIKQRDIGPKGKAVSRSAVVNKQVGQIHWRWWTSR